MPGLAEGKGRAQAPVLTGSRACGAHLVKQQSVTRAKHECRKHHPCLLAAAELADGPEWHRAAQAQSPEHGARALVAGVWCHLTCGAQHILQGHLLLRQLLRQVLRENRHAGVCLDPAAARPERQSAGHGSQQSALSSTVGPEHRHAHAALDGARHVLQLRRVVGPRAAPAEGGFLQHDRLIGARQRRRQPEGHAACVARAVTRGWRLVLNALRPLKHLVQRLLLALGRARFGCLGPKPRNE